MTWKELVLASVLAFAGAFTLLSPLFIADKAVFGGDAIAYDYPTLQFYADRVQAGESVQWNPYYLGGFPTVLSPVGDYIDPLVPALLSITRDGFTTLHVRLAISLALTLLFAYVCGRLLRLRPDASTILAVTYLLSQSMYDFTSGLINSGAMAAIPAMFACVLLIQRSGAIRAYTASVVALSLVLAYAWMSGFVQIVLYGAIFAGLYAMYCDFPTARSLGMFRFFSWKTTLGTALGIGVSLVLAAPRLYDTFAFRSLTRRTSGFGTGDIDGISLGHVLHLFIPDYVYVPFLLPEVANGFFLGAISLVCVLIALTFLRNVRPVPFFLVSIAAIIMILIPALHISDVIQSLPIFSLFHNLKRLLVVAGFLLAVVAAFGFENLVRGLTHISERARARMASVLVWCSVIGTVLFLLVIAVVAIIPLDDPGFRAQVLTRLIGAERAGLSHYQNVFSLTVSSLVSTLSISNWRVVVPILSIALASVLIAFRLRARIPDARFSNIGVVLSIATIAFVYVAQYDRMISVGVMRQSPAVMEILPPDSGDYYLIPYLTGEAMFRNVLSRERLTPDAAYSLQREVLAANINVPYRIPRVDGYEPYSTSRASEMWEHRVKNEALPQSASFDDALVEKRRDFLSWLPVLSAYNVRFVMAGYELEDFRLRLTKTYSPHPDLRLYVYENISAEARVSVPSEVRTVPSWDESMFAILKQGIMVVECGECSDKIAAQRGADISHTITSIGRVSFSVTAKQATWVMIAQSNLPGWEARIDGRIVPIHSAGYLMQALLIPEGTHEVTLSYMQ